ncbi:hypothetical protein CG51_05255 [Haematobacter missouriensis]|uniref:Uncharacterized protein n=1 Tax=Haematobacter missouriensis TaxID=366616 RepID=A0A212AHX1_9RHOB|nr:hypothetical protein [Haematobacter missouriensis]KFI34294.1 hypothetical protein CG51_05255 [Haematobacter missouriensis]OWJ72394.1 hypothetical protein CDV53_17510 [Haematobacter missouriensis]OWJ81102.1 hypothetical protein CDV52_19675 [Haematobacter missouriensis]
MTFDAFYELSLATRVAVGAGFLAYGLAYAGLRQDHSAVDVFLGTLAFSVLATLVFQQPEDWSDWSRAACAIGVTLCVALLWRAWLRDFCIWAIGKLGVHREDGVHRSWAALVQTKRKVGQISVHTRDGRTLYLNNRQIYSHAPWEGLYLGGDGSVIMAVEEEEFPDGSEEQREDVHHAEWGTRMTYIPASEVVRVNIRLK